MQKHFSLVEDAHEAGLNHNKSTLRESRKALGQFMTPDAIANVMAENIVLPNVQTLRILEPSAGVGILAAAILEKILCSDHKPEKIELTLFEIDQTLINKLKEVIDKMRAAAAASEVEFTANIHVKDFLLFDCKKEFDIIIANPPYFKIRKADPRATNFAFAVYGQPNIYGLFMVACAARLSQTGVFCFLTPRSWTTGLYFSAVRRFLISRLDFKKLHYFYDRRTTFAKDNVLQEMMISWAHARCENSASSVGGDENLALQNIFLNGMFPEKKFFEDTAKSYPLDLLGSGDDILQERFKKTLRETGLRASTGKVVPHRAKKWILSRKSIATIPLFWMQHVTRGNVSWPNRFKKEHLKVHEKTIKLLTHNANYVVVRRFSPKDQERWIVAAPFMKFGNYENIAFENHLNYIYSPSHSLTKEEVVGLSAYLNSSLVNLYLRKRSGHTQLNAKDLNDLPIPPISTIKKLGSLMLKLEQIEIPEEALVKILFAQG